MIFFEKYQTRTLQLNQKQCPVCGAKELELLERETEVPYFGKVFLFSMTCTSCKYHTSDVEANEEKDPCKFTFEISTEEDMKVRVVKSAQATVRLPHISTIEPGTAAQGYVTNIEGILNRVKYQLENLKENAEDDGDKTKAKNLLKKIQKIKWGQEKQKIIIEDPSGNSAIISDKAERTALRVKKAA